MLSRHWEFRPLQVPFPSRLATRDKENTETTTQRVRQEEEGVYLQQITALALSAVLAGLQDPPCGASGA